MELIKQIKKAEQEAKEIIEKARADAVSICEQAVAKGSEELAQAEQDRKVSIAEAVSKAQEGGAAEVEELIKQGEQCRNEIANKARTKIDMVVQKVVDSIK